MKTFNGKTALITGGTTGIGLAIAKRLAGDGAHVILNYAHNEEQALEAQKEIGENAALLKADVTSEEDVKSMFECIEKEHPTLDILVNNAGIDIEATIEECSYDLWKKILGVNLDGAFLCTKYATPLLKKSKGSIVNIASRMGTKPVTEIVPYCVSKSGIIMLTKGTALELAEYGIRVNAVSPGLTRTALTEQLCDEDFFEGYAERNPLGRVGEAEDIAKAVAFVASDEAGFITGENIDVSGGILLK